MATIVAKCRAIFIYLCVFECSQMIIDHIHCHKQTTQRTERTVIGCGSDAGTINYLNTALTKFKLK